MTPSRCSTRNEPRKTTVNSAKSGVCPGSTQPPGLRMRATLTALVCEFTRPIYSSISFGLFPAAVTRAGESISVGISRIVTGLQCILDLRMQRLPLILALTCFAAHAQIQLAGRVVDET